MKKAIVLLSGGLDSTTCLAIAKSHGFEIYALSFSYGQRHDIELKMAKKIAKKFAVKEHKTAKIDLTMFGHSALTDEIAVPKNRHLTSSKKEKKNNSESIPITYVPARNTIFLSHALAYAEVIGAFDIFIGVNAVDYSGYPDCREEFIRSFERLSNLATAAGVRNKGKLKIHTPLIAMSKKEIIQSGLKLGVDYSITHSCYDPIIKKNKAYACGSCDSCQLRLQGFKETKTKDPILYY
jgi:7-cyano-7-deazaguanine synthase